jgi:hypothetical protein
MLLLALVLMLAACSDDAGDEVERDPAAAASAALDDADATPNPDVTGDGTTTTTAPPTTSSTSTTSTTVPGIAVNENTLGIDECFNREEGLSAGRTRVITTLVDCADPHGFQIFFNVQYPADPDVPYPGDDIMVDFALASCYQGFEGWAGAAYETSGLEIGVFTPDRETFEEQSYRRILCYVFRSDGELLIGTARGSGL